MIPIQTIQSSQINGNHMTQTVQASVYKKFQKFMSGQRQQNLYQRLRNFHGKNYAINYKPEYKFTQQWQGKINTQMIGERNLLQQNGFEYFLYSLTFMVVNIASIWAMSVERYFDTKIISQGSFIFHILLIFTMMDIGLNIYYQNSQPDSYRFDLFQQLKFNLKHLVTCGYVFFLIFGDTQGQFYYFLQFFIMMLMYKKVADIHKCIKVTEFSLKYENQMKIIDLFVNVFIQAHIFAIILFSASKINPQRNWTDAIGITRQVPLTKYIYSFYFASTTMLTIGYGDITPKCPQEIIITVMIQIVGVVSFGYMLNEMGHTLSKMRKQSEELERDLQTISKISKYYNLEKKLQNKAKNFIVSNQVKSQELKIEDQCRVLMKLNEDLRQEINTENSLTVVKSCIFFLCHWSKNMQSEIAKRLEKRLFSPNEKLIHPNGFPRVYIIKRGRIDISMNRYGIEQEYRKLLKIINTVQHKEVSNNIYGYTTVFSNRPVRLQAIAKEFTSTYSVNRDQFLECIRQNLLDFEYYHEVKCRIDQSAFCEEWEAPSIKSIRQHFSPSRIITIKKQRKCLQKSVNHRHTIIRRIKTKNFKILQNLIIQNWEREQYQNDAQKTIVFMARNKRWQKNEKFQQSQYNNGQSAQYLGSNVSLEDDSIKQSYKQAKASSKTRSRTKAADQKANKQLIAHNFEANKEFLNFFKRNNISNVLLDLEKENFLERNINRNVGSIVNYETEIINLAIKKLIKK